MATAGGCEAVERFASVLGASTRALPSGVLRGSGDRRRSRAAVRLASLDREPAKLGDGALAGNRRQCDTSAAGPRPDRLSTEHAAACASHPRRACGSATAGSERQRNRPPGSAVGRARRRRFDPAGARWHARRSHHPRAVRGLWRSRAARPAGGRPRREQVRSGNRLPNRGAHGERTVVRGPAQEPDRASDRKPGRGRAAVPRTGNDRLERSCDAHPGAAAPRLRTPRARGAAGDRGQSPGRRDDRLRRTAGRPSCSP
jgi:hypothetical protein